MIQPNYTPTKQRSTIKKNPIQISSSNAPSSSKYIYPIQYPEGIIDVSNQILNDDQLEDLLKYLKKNIKIGNVKWSEDQDRFDSKFCKIIKRLKKNNQSFNYHPNDYLCGILSQHVYLDKSIFEKPNVDFRDILMFKTGEYPSNQLEFVDSYLSELKIISFENVEGFQYALYENKKLHHLVLAFRGTSTNSAKDFLFSFIEDSIGITLKKENSYQQKKALEVTEKVVEICKSSKYNLTITGHSLGAWLAELSHYYCFYRFNFTKVKTVVFDSPGALDQFRVYDDHKEPSIPYSSMDITAYLSEPNIVNCMNNHILECDSTFRIYPAGIDNVDDSKLDFVLSTKFHMLIPIIQCFDYLTGKPKEYKVVKNWPYITPTQLSEYFDYFKHNDNGYLENPDNKPIEGVKYKVEQVNLFGGSLISSLFRIDQYIIQLYEKNYFFSFNDYFISTQLKELKNYYSLENNQNKYEIKIRDQGITFEILRQRLSRLIDLNPKLIQKLLKSKDDEKDFKQYKIRSNPNATSSDFYDPNNYLEKIEKIYERGEHLVVITGEEGSGKSSLALEYALEKHSKISKFENYQVLFIRADSKEMIMEDFGSILLKNYKEELNGYDFNLSSNQLIDFYKTIMDSSNTFYFFIFDNVSDISIVEPFLFYLSKSNTKVILTSQLGKGHYKKKNLLGKQSIDDVLINVQLLNNEQANNYLNQKGVKTNFNFACPISIHLLNILLKHEDHIQNSQPDNSNPVDFNETLTCLIKDFIKSKPESIDIIQLLPFLDVENISFEILSKIINKPNYNLEENIKYWSNISILNELPNKRVNSYKNIQSIILKSFLSNDQINSIQEKIIQLFESLDLSGDYPKGWRVYYSHLRYFYNNFKEIINFKIIENYGICLKLLSLYQESIKYLNESLEMKKKSNCSKYEVSLTLFEIGKTLMKSDNYSEALKYFMDCLQWEINENQNKLSETFNNIGFCHFHLNNKNELALHNYNQALKLETRLEFQTIINFNIGSFYLANDRVVESKTQFLKSLETLDQIEHQETPIYAKTVFKLSLVEYKENNFMESISKFKRSLGMFKKLFKSSNHKDIATCYHMIGLCYYQMDNGKNTEYLLNSLENLEQSLNLRLKIHRTNLSHKDLDESYHSLGVLHNKRREHQLSFNNFKKSYDIKKLNENCDLLESLENLSTQSYLNKDYEISIDYTNKQLNLLNDSPNEYSISKCYNHLGNCYRKLNQSSSSNQSILNYKKSIDLLLILIKTNEKKSKQVESNLTNSNNKNMYYYFNELVELYEIIGSSYYGLSIVDTDKKNSKQYKKNLNHYYNLLKELSTGQFKNELSNLSKLKDSEWFNTYSPNSFFSFVLNRKVLILSSSIIIASIYIKFSQNQDQNN